MAENKEEKVGSLKPASKGEDEGIVKAAKEIRKDARFTKRAFELLGIILIARVLVLFVVTPIQNMTWNRKNSFDVSFTCINYIVWRRNLL
jgi:hypothetical protein